MLAQFVRDLRNAGQAVDVSIWGPSRHDGWGGSDLTETPGSFEEVLTANQYDFVFCANLFLLPLVFPHLNGARPVLVYQGHESYWYGRSYEEVMAEVPLLIELLQLPIHVIAVSRSIQETLRNRVGIESWFVPAGIDVRHFYQRSTFDVQSSPKRIVMVGSYLFPLKGIRDGLEALRKLSTDIDLIAVLITAETRGRGLLNNYPFPVELHCRVNQATIGDLYRGSHLYLCPSWYEGLGLPALESFACGTPVVCTRHAGVIDYGIDRYNLLLAQPHDPDDIAEKVREVLSDSKLASMLSANALESVRSFTNVNSLTALVEFQTHCMLTSAPIQSADEMNALIHRMEAEGLFTPLSTQQTFLSISNELQSVCNKLVNATITAEDALRIVNKVKEQTASHLQFPNSEYYSSFKARHDMCRLLGATIDPDELKRVAQTILRSKSL